MKTDSSKMQTKIVRCGRILLITDLDGRKILGYIQNGKLIKN